MNKSIYWWRGSNHGSLGSEVTDLPAGPWPLTPINSLMLHWWCSEKCMLVSLLKYLSMNPFIWKVWTYFHSTPHDPEVTGLSPTWCFPFPSLKQRPVLKLKKLYIIFGTEIPMREKKWWFHYIDQQKSVLFIVVRNLLQEQLHDDPSTHLSRSDNCFKQKQTKWEPK